MMSDAGLCHTPAWQRAGWLRDKTVSARELLDAAGEIEEALGASRRRPPLRG